MGNAMRPFEYSSMLSIYTKYEIMGKKDCSKDEMEMKSVKEANTCPFLYVYPRQQ